MTYLPVMTITVKRNRLTESTDMTQPLSAFVNVESYLVVTQNTFTYILSIGKILTFTANLDKTKPIGQAFSTLLNDLFIANFGSNPIPIKMTSGLYTKRLSVLNPFAYKDYEVKFTSVDTPTVVDDVTKKGFLDDLAISSSHDMSQCLVAVNGVFHRTAFLNNTVYALDGFRTIRLTNHKDVTLVDTRAIGGHTIIPLTTANVTKPAYQQDAIVTLPQSVAGKTVFLVIDGYFYHRDQNIFDVADNTHLRIKTNKLPLVQQFRHNPRVMHQPDRYGNTSQSSRKYTDPYELMFLQNRTVDTTLLENADFQYSRLTAYHSFAVVMNNPNLYTVTADVIPTGTPQFYYEQSRRNISGMMTYGCGLCPSYLIWKDPSGRKSIFLPEQDYDVDRQDESIAPPFIPTLIKEISPGTQLRASFVDYVSA